MLSVEFAYGALTFLAIGFVLIVWLDIKEKGSKHEKKQKEEAK